MSNDPTLKEKVIHITLLAVSCISILVLLLIVFFLFWEGVPILKSVSPGDFLLGMDWYPTADPPEYGILALLISSLAVMGCAALIAVPVAVMTALYLSELAPPRMRMIFKSLLELLAAIPSVVLGFLGLAVLAPMVQEIFGVPTGLNMFSASLLLALMIIPTVCSISEDAIFGVSREMKEASLALGSTKWETIRRIVIPASLPGITSAIILGMSRAIGETMIVLMVAGGAAMIPESLFDPVRPLSATIAAEMAEAPFRSMHYRALFAVGIVLFLLTLAFNVVAGRISGKFRYESS